MKTWNAPAVEELDVKLTAGGLFDTNFETLILFNDSYPFKCPQTEEEDS